MKTRPTKISDIKRNWWHIDMDGQILGRASSEVAKLLIGKNKPYLVNFLDCGDYVIITNADKVDVTGKKRKQKVYYRHSGYPGGLKESTLGKQLAKDSRKVIMNAVKGMLPKNKLQTRRLKRLKIFKGEKHTFEDKKPQAIKTKSYTSLP